MPPEPPTAAGLPFQRLVLVRGAVARPLLSPPESRFHYGSNHHVLAGAMLERAQSRTWPELIQEQLFAPLGLCFAGLGTTERRRQGDRDSP